MEKPPDLLDFVIKLLLSLSVALLTKFFTFITVRTLSVIQHIISYVKQRQKIRHTNFDADIEEMLGDFSEKYSNIPQLTLTRSGWEFLRMALFDTACLSIGLVRIAFLRVLGIDETPPA